MVMNDLDLSYIGVWDIWNNDLGEVNDRSGSSVIGITDSTKARVSRTAELAPTVAPM